MHLLRSTAIGTEIIDEEEHHVQGIVADLLLDPDRGKLVALLVHSPASSELLALQIADILSWGKRVHIQEAERLGSPQEIIRLAPFLEGKRRIIGQPIRTKSGTLVGKCVDIQFDAERFGLEWIFPRRFLRKGIPLPASDILEVTEEAIVVKDQIPKEEKVLVAEEEAAPEKLEPVITPTPGCSTRSATSGFFSIFSAKLCVST